MAEIWLLRDAACTEFPLPRRAGAGGLVCAARKDDELEQADAPVHLADGQKHHKVGIAICTAMGEQECGVRFGLRQLFSLRANTRCISLYVFQFSQDRLLVECEERCKYVLAPVNSWGRGGGFAITSTPTLLCFRPIQSPPLRNPLLRTTRQQTNRSGLSQLKPVGVFGRTPAVAGNPTDRQLVPGQKVGKKLGWSPHRSPGRRSSSEGVAAGDSGERKTSKTGRNKSRGDLAHDSELGGDTSSSSEQGEEEGEDKEEEEDEAKSGKLDARPAAVGEQVAGRDAGTGGKRRGVGAMFRRRFRSVKGHKDALSAVAAAATAAASRQPKRGDRLQALDEGGARDHDNSSCSSSSSSSSSLLRLPPAALSDVAMKTPAGIFMNRGLTGGREIQHGSAGTDADAHPGSPHGSGAGQSGGGAGRREDTLLGLEHDNGSRGGGVGKPCP